MQEKYKIKKEVEVSVIIPTHNRASLLKRAVKSVLSQTYQNFEIIIVDDFSNDNTTEVVKEFKRDPRIKYLKFYSHKGASAARNEGIRVAKGSFVAFLDSDDEWLPTKLEKQIIQFRSLSEKVGVVYSGLLKINEGNIVGKRMPVAKGILKNNLFERNYIGPLSTGVVRMRCLKVCGGFDENLPACQDWDLWIQISQKYEFEFINEPLVRYHINQNSITFNFKNRALGYKIILYKYYRKYKRNRKAYGKILAITAHYLVCMGKIREGRNEFIRSILCFPLSFKSYVLLLASLFGTKGYKNCIIMKDNAIRGVLSLIR